MLLSSRGWLQYDNPCCAGSAKTKSKCFLGGGGHHDRSVCATRNVICFKYIKEGHFSKMCRSNPNQKCVVQICSNMLSQTSDNVDEIKHYILFFRIPKIGRIMRVSREKRRHYSPNGRRELKILYFLRLCEETQTTDETCNW